MEKLLEIIIASILISGLMSSAIETFKNRLEAQEIKFGGNTWFFISILISLIVSFGITMYFQGLNVQDSIAVYLVVVFGAQGFYQVVIDKGGK